MNTASEFLTVDEAAELLRVNRKTLYEAIQTQRRETGADPPWALRVGKVLRINRLALLGSPPSNRAAGDSKQ